MWVATGGTVKLAGRAELLMEKVADERRVSDPLSQGLSVATFKEKAPLPLGGDD